MTSAVVEDESLKAIGRAQTKRMALKITEYTGGTGEHYVARNRREYWAQFRAGACGGCVTSFTALIKFGLSALPLAPVVLATGLAANYTISFWILQIFHFALASKQPAMTASALATSLADRSDMEHNIELIAAISRSQAAVTVSNVGATVVLSLLLDFLFHLLTGRYFLSTETAEHALRGINPVLTLTALYAAITGVFLWVSSLAAGAAANWIAYRQLAEATREDSRVKQLFGKAFARRLGDFVAAHVGGMTGYLVLGFLLGFVPVLLSRFFGIALEVRHVTLHAAAAAYGVLPLHAAGELVPRDIFWGFVGIAVIGFFNFTVSAWLALLTAARARNLGPAERSLLWQAIRLAFLERPTRFFWVPARERKSFEMPTTA
jgi:site-specific recombinase